MHDWLWPMFATGLALMLSGILHVVVGLALQDDWHGPLSFRKPALFGLSTGLTCVSISWIWGQIKTTWFDPAIVWLTAFALLFEVTLITLQTWRGVPSHFNHESYKDAFIEVAMLVLITAASVGILWLTIRCLLPNVFLNADDAMRLAIRAGLVLLIVSLGLGFLISAIGWEELRAGRSPHIYPPGGVLKFPHGACLHAVQTLPLMAGLWRWLGSRYALARVAHLTAAHVAFLIFACWQTFHGLPREELHALGIVWIAAAGLLALFSLLPDSAFDATIPNWGSRHNADDRNAMAADDQ
ncbi:MAG: hypothetical protein C0478_16195 [Planctomyces sp.]|nr:hypothetical protein [Planctomyces sp.]